VSTQELFESPGRVVVDPRKAKDLAESGVSYLTNLMGAGQQQIGWADGKGTV